MRFKYELSRLLLTLAAGIAVADPALSAEADPWDGTWHHDIALYGWFPGVKGTVSVELPSGVSVAGSAQVAPSSYLSSLQFAGMILGQARKGDLAFFTDIVYTDFADLKSKVRDVSTPGGRVTLPLNEDLNFALRALVWTAGASYTVARAPEARRARSTCGTAWLPHTAASRSTANAGKRRSDLQEPVLQRRPRQSGRELDARWPGRWRELPMVSAA